MATVKAVAKAIKETDTKKPVKFLNLNQNEHTISLSEATDIVIGRKVQGWNKETKRAEASFLTFTFKRKDKVIKKLVIGNPATNLLWTMVPDLTDEAISEIEKI